MDVDDEALGIAARNCGQFEDLHIDFVRADVTRLPTRLRADTVITCVRARRPAAAAGCVRLLQQPD